MQRLIAITLVCLIGLTGVGPARAEKDEDTPKAAKTRKLLKTKITLDIKDVPLREVMDEISDDHVKGVNIIVDTKGGVSQNQKLSFSGKDVTLEDAPGQDVRQERPGLLRHLQEGRRLRRGHQDRQRQIARLFEAVTELSVLAAGVACKPRRLPRVQPWAAVDS